MIATTFDGIVDMPSGCDVLAVSVTVSQRIVVITGGLRGAISAGLRVGLAAFRTLTRINLRAWWTRLLWYHLWALLPSCCDVVTIGLTVSLRIVAITGGLRGAASAGLRVCCVNPRIARKIKRSISCVKLGAVKLDKRKIEERYSTYECRCRMGGGGRNLRAEKYGGGDQIRTRSLTRSNT